MKFTELQKEDIAYQQYSYFQSLLAITNSKPIKAVMIKNAKSDTLIIYKKRLTGLQTVSTRKFTLPKEETIFFLSALSEDFPDLEFECVK